MDDTPSVLTVTDVVTRVRQRPVLAVAPVMLGLLLSVVYVVLTPASYSATTSVKVEPVVADRYAGNINLSNTLSMPTEMQVVQSRSVASLAATVLAVDATVVRHSIAVDSPQDTQVLNITYTAGTPERAAEGARTVAESYLKYSKQTKQKVAQTQYDKVLADIADVKAQIALKPSQALSDQLAQLRGNRASLENLLANDAGEVISEAVPPTSPAAPKPLVAIPAAIGLGLIAGLALAVLWPTGRRRTTAPVPPRGVQRPVTPGVRREPVPGIVPGRPVTAVTSSRPGSDGRGTGR